MTQNAYRIILKEEKNVEDYSSMGDQGFEAL